MSPVLKKSLWIGGALAVVAALAVPKLLPEHKETVSKKPAAPAAEKSSGKGESGGAPLKVSAVRVQGQPFAETVSATGTLLAEESVELQAEASGRVVAIAFNEGSRVKKGALLVKLNDAELRAGLARAKQLLSLAQTREQRLKPLLAENLVRQEDYDIGLSEVKVQGAEIALIEAQIAKTEIRAPFDGVVGLRYVSEGAYVSAATRVATLQRLDRLKVDFALPEKYATRIRIGAPLRFSVAGADHHFDARIYALDPRVDAGTRSVQIRALADNAEQRLLPGSFAAVELVMDRIDNALLVPAVAVMPGLDEKNVFVLQDGKAQRRAVETGTRTTSVVQILSGLQSGEVVITSGLQNMRDGQKVAADVSNTAVPAPAPAAATARKPRGASALPSSAHGAP